MIEILGAQFRALRVETASSMRHFPLSHIALCFTRRDRSTSHHHAMLSASGHACRIVHHYIPGCVFRPSSFHCISPALSLPRLRSMQTISLRMFSFLKVVTLALSGTSRTTGQRAPKTPQVVRARRFRPHGVTRLATAKIHVTTHAAPSLRRAGYYTSWSTSCNTDVLT